MADGQIPTNAEDLPIDTVPMDDSKVYVGELRKFTCAMKLDKRGGMYASIQIEVTEGEFEGRTVMMNYLALPMKIDPDATRAERIKALDRAVTFGRFSKAFKVKGTIPYADGLEGAQGWNNWMETFLGNGGKFTISNQEYPEGSGRIRSGIADFVA